MQECCFNIDELEASGEKGVKSFALGIGARRMNITDLPKKGLARVGFHFIVPLLETFIEAGTVVQQVLGFQPAVMRWRERFRAFRPLENPREHDLNV